MDKGETKDNLTQRQVNFINYWLDQKSKTYDNIRQSAMKAGYSQYYADSLGRRIPHKVSKKMTEGRNSLNVDKLVIALNKIVNCLEDVKERKRLGLDTKDITTSIKLAGTYLKMFTEKTELDAEVSLNYIITRASEPAGPVEPSKP